MNVNIYHEKMQYASPVETGVHVAFKMVMYQLSNLVKRAIGNYENTSFS
jgi:hypothetical protein